MQTSLGNSLDRLLGRTQTGEQVNVGIAGGSGSGKSTIAQRIKEELPNGAVEIIGMDRFFKPVAELPPYWSAFHQEQRRDFNRPDSFRVDRMFAECAAVAGFDVVIFDGHFTLYFSELRVKLAFA